MPKNCVKKEFKSPYHSKSAIDGMHNFPRQVAEKENSQNRALNIPDLIEACYKRELELRNEIIATTSEKKRSGDYKRFFINYRKRRQNFC